MGFFSPRNARVACGKSGSYLPRTRLGAARGSSAPWWVSGFPLLVAYGDLPYFLEHLARLMSKGRVKKG